MASTRGRTGPEWTSAITTLSMVVIFVVVAGTLYWAQTIFIPIALAVLMSFVLSPAVSRLQRWGAGRTLAVIVVMVFAIGTFLSVGTLVAQQMVRLSDTLPDHAPNIIAKVKSAKSWLLGEEESRMSRLVEDLSAIFNAKPKEASAQTVTIWGLPVHTTPEPQRIVVESQSSSWLASVQSVLNPAVEVLAMAAFANVLVIFMLLKREDLRNRMIRLIGHGRVTTTTKAVDDATTRISRFLLTQLALNVGFGIVMTIGLFFIGLAYPILWGFIAFLMRYVPYIGTWIGLIPPAVFSLAVSEGWGQPFAVVALFLGVEAICNNVFEPWLYGSSMGLSQVAQLVAAGFWAFLWGPIGLILSGPLTVCLLVMGKYVRRLEFLDVLLGDEPALSPRVAFYQRLAARDQDEAAIIAMTQAKKEGPEVVYDTIILPALSLAKRDHEAGILSEENWDEAVRATREVSEEVAEVDAEETSGAVVVEGIDERIRALLVPARDTADLAAVEMCAHRLDPTRWDAEVAPVGILASELVEKVRKFQPSVAVIASLPPGGLAHTRYLVTRLRSKFPELKILVGRWGFSEDLGEERETAGIEGADWQHETLSGSLQYLAEYAPVFLQQSAPLPNSNDDQKTPRIGTSTAS